MARLSTLGSVAPLVASCLLHVVFVGGALALGQIWPPHVPVLLEAELVAPEPPTPVPTLPEAPKPTPPKPKVVPRPEPTVLPKLIETPPPREATPPPDPKPAPPARVADASPPSPLASEAPRAVAPSAPRAPEVSLPASVDSGPAMAIAPAPPVTAKVAPEAPVQLAHPKGGYQVRPSYPSTARRLGVEGTTKLRVYVAADGQVTEVLVDESAGHPDLDRAAVDAVRRWRFEPGRRGADAIGMWVRLPVQFVLR